MPNIRELFEKRLGFGTMRLPLEADGKTIDYQQFKEMIDAYLKQGFCYFDTAWPYHEGNSEIAVRECLVKRYPREQFLLADKMPLWDRKSVQEMEDIFAQQLTKCGVSYFDLYLLHNICAETYETIKNLDGFAFLRQLKQEGKVRYIGFSFHDSPTMLEEILSLHPEVDFVQLQINYYDWENPSVASRECYEIARKYNKPVIVMEPVKGGSLANLPESVRTLFSTLNLHATPASFAIRYAASLPQVMVVLSGMSNKEQLSDNTAYMREFQPFNEAEQQAVKQAAEQLHAIPTIPCTGCAYCVEGCPMQIAIPRIFKMVNNQRQFNQYPNIKARYQDITEGKGKAGDCIGCGNCEAHCPQHIKIREELQQIAKEYE